MFTVTLCLLSTRPALEVGRRAALHRALHSVSFGAAASVAGLVAAQLRILSAAPTAGADGTDNGEEMQQLRSQNELAPRRKELEREWRGASRSRNRESECFKLPWPDRHPAERRSAPTIGRPARRERADRRRHACRF